MSPSSESYLPSLPAQSYTPASKKNVIAEQPMTTQVMSLQTSGPPNPPQMVEGAERLRGGCIPCPDGGCCYIIPLPCCCC